MKKLVVVVFLFLLLISNVNHQNTFTLKDYVNGEYSVYTTNKVNEKSIFLGTCFLTEEEIVENNVVGESVKTSNTEIVEFLNDLDAEIVFTETLDSGAVVISAFSPKIKDKVEMKGKNVNLQIATYTDYSIIGWPVILGSF